MGCGDGGFSAQFVKAEWQVWGVDLSESQVSKARAEGIKAEQQDLTSGLNFPDKFFSLVFAGEVIEHLVDTDALIEEAWRLLKPGGIFILTTANLASLNNRVRLLIGWYPTFMDYSAREGVGHVRYYTLDPLRRQLSQHGFLVQAVSGSHVPLIPTRWTFRPGFPKFIFPFAFRLGNLFPTISMELIIESRRPQY
jgi:2-polyprenyl-3-methyl-5-hydroxy-6-metoxy-1,4-benzoquinol methylase